MEMRDKRGQQITFISWDLKFSLMFTSWHGTIHHKTWIFTISISFSLVGCSIYITGNYISNYSIYLLLSFPRTAECLKASQLQGFQDAPETNSTSKLTEDDVEKWINAGTNTSVVAEFTDEQLIQSIFNLEKSKVAEKDDIEEPKICTWMQGLVISKPAEFAKSRAMTLQQKWWICTILFTRKELHQWNRQISRTSSKRPPKVPLHRFLWYLPTSSPTT